MAQVQVAQAHLIAVVIHSLHLSTLWVVAVVVRQALLAKAVGLVEVMNAQVPQAQALKAKVLQPVQVLKAKVRAVVVLEKLVALTALVKVETACHRALRVVL